MKDTKLCNKYGETVGVKYDAVATANPRVSLQICTKDRHTEVAMLLESLRHQTFTSWDLVLCDGSKFPNGHPNAGQPNLFANTKFGHDMIIRLKMEGHGVQVIIDDGSGVVEARNMCITKDVFENNLLIRLDDDSIVDEQYLERIYNIITKGLVKEKKGYRLPNKGEEPDVKPEKIGGVSGVVPTFGAADFKRNVDCVGEVMSKIEFDDNGNITVLGDDAGYLYNEARLLPTHHLRSSFIFRRDAAIKVGMFPIGLGPTGFREESKFSVKLLMAGYKLFVDTGAICWHNMCPSGGCRAPDYAQKVQMGDIQFRRWFKHMISIKKLNRDMFDCSKWVIKNG